ncbi:hypothetical protein V5799_023000 [Amblyomma americanum]|uniref:Uncharacterized protein n=1 Tax=Amblyomma americanum TaxID=6943 RepID=A0AAQ4FKE4_AMBAM
MLIRNTQEDRDLVNSAGNTVPVRLSQKKCVQSKSIQEDYNESLEAGSESSECLSPRQQNLSSEKSAVTPPLEESLCDDSESKREREAAFQSDGVLHPISPSADGFWTSVRTLKGEESEPKEHSTASDTQSTNTSDSNPPRRKRSSLEDEMMKGSKLYTLSTLETPSYLKASQAANVLPSRRTNKSRHGKQSSDAGHIESSDVSTLHKNSDSCNGYGTPLSTETLLSRLTGSRYFRPCESVNAIDLRRSDGRFDCAERSPDTSANRDEKRDRPLERSLQVKVPPASDAARNRPWNSSDDTKDNDESQTQYFTPHEGSGSSDVCVAPNEGAVTPQVNDFSKMSGVLGLHQPSLEQEKCTIGRTADQALLHKTNVTAKTAVTESEETEKPGQGNAPQRKLLNSTSLAPLQNGPTLATRDVESHYDSKLSPESLNETAKPECSPDDAFGAMKNATTATPKADDAEHGPEEMPPAVLIQAPLPAERIIVMRYKVAGILTVSLVLLAALVIFTVGYDYFFSRPSNEETSNTPAIALKAGSANQSLATDGVSVFQSDEEAQPDVAVLDVNDEV